MAATENFSGDFSATLKYIVGTLWSDVRGDLLKIFVIVMIVTISQTVIQ